MISYENALVYFSVENHHKSDVWSSFSDDKRRGALVFARRTLARALARSMRDDESAYVEGDTTRDEYAVYEQALWVLENGQIGNASGGDPVPVLTGRMERMATPKSGLFSLIAPEAMRWLGVVGGSVMRG